jgi:hypothetical protein
VPYRLHGVVIDVHSGLPLVGLKVEAWDEDTRHHDLLGVAHTGADGTFLIAFDERYFRDHPLDHSPDVFFRVFEGERMVHTTETAPHHHLPAGRHEFTIAIDAAVLDHATTGPPATGSGDREPDGTGAPGPGEVVGRLSTAYGGPAGAVTLRFSVPGFAGADIHLADVVTGEDGRFRLDVPLPARVTRLSVRALAPDGTEVTVLDPDRRLDLHAPLQLVADDRVVPILEPEYDRLVRDLRPHLGGARLADAREDGQRRDLTVLHEATGWDARLIALAALAEHVAYRTGVPPAAAYAMVRTGLPAGGAELLRVSGVAVGRALSKAAAAGLVDLTGDDIDAARRAFESYAERARPRQPVPGGHSGIGEVFAAAGLTAGQRTTAQRLLAEHTGEPGRWWDAVRQARLPVAKLRLAIRLGQLTLDNAPLVADLTAGVDDPDRLGAWLVAQQLYQPQQWRQRLQRLATEGAGNGERVAPDPLAVLIPAGYTGDTGQRLAAYAGDLAAKVRRSYPTLVAGQQVRSGELPLPGAGPELVGDVAAVLERAAAEGYALGATPLHRFLADHGDRVRAGLPAARADAAVAHLGTLQRLYQITRGDDELRVLLAAGLTAAHQIANIPQQTFAHRFAGALGGPAADKLWHRAWQVTTVTYAFLGAAAQAATAPALPAVLPTASSEPAREALIRNVPTLESLFGSQDYCECDHCRSVLSPAAYLVDLLGMLDLGQLRWDAELAAWQAAHGGATYPYRSPQAHADAGAPTPRTPYQVLDERRPDLSQLPLTCENTNTVLPYVDIVNEILEYYLVNDRLDPDAAHDTGESDSADLLAEPQHLLPAAYDLLSQASYPLTLPFDLWLETVRAFAAHFDTPLWQLLDALRTTDEPFPPPGHGYGRAAVAFERLGFSTADISLLATTDRQARWLPLYGYDPDAWRTEEVTAELSRAAVLARRLGVSYRELVALVRTGFINPHLPTLATLRKLDVSTEDVLRYHQHAGFPPLAVPAREAFVHKLGDAGVAWVHDAYQRGEFTRILVLADPSDGCGFETTTVQYADGTPAEPLVFLQLNLLTRIWRRLGGSIADLDRALSVFLPGDPDPRTSGSLGPALTSALLGIAHLHQIAEMLGVRAGDRAELLPLWSPLDDRSYTALFLSGPAATRDEIVDDPLGRYLSWLDGDGYRPFHFDPRQPEDRGTGNVSLRSHLGTVQAALGMTADEVQQVLAMEGLDLPTAPLNLTTVSLLHRHAMLARSLRLSITDLLVMRELTGLDPFTPPADRPVTRTSEDHPYRHTIGFVAAVQELLEPGWNVAELDYLLRHRFDQIGPHRAAALPPLRLVQDLTAATAAIVAAYAVPADPLTFTDEALGRALAQVLPAPVAVAVMAMWTGEEPLDGEVIEEHLRQRDVPGIGQVGFLPDGDDAALFTPTPHDQAAEATRRALIAGALLPYVRERLVRAEVVRIVAADLAAEVPTVQALLGDPALLDDPDHSGQALLSGYLAGARHGLTASAGVPVDTVTVSGYLEVPVTGSYEFSVAGAATGTTVTLRCDHLPDPVWEAVAAGGADGGGDPPAASVELRGGLPYGFTFSHTGGVAELRIRGEHLPARPVHALATYPRDGVDRLHRTHLLLAKVLRVADAVGLADVEFRHLLAVAPGDPDTVGLRELPTRAGDGAAPPAKALGSRLRHMIGWVRLRRSTAIAPPDLVDLMSYSRRTIPDRTEPDEFAATVLTDGYGRFATLTRREVTAVHDAADLLGATVVRDGDAVLVEVLADQRRLHRLWRILQLAAAAGVGPAALGRWADPAPSASVARDLRDTVRACYSPPQWRRVVQPISDRLRQQRRDALVAHLLHTMHLDRMEQLFEHFLIDPGTEPVVQTSRLRLAISSVQTFIQRCLLNLEPAVAPSVLDADQWQWMRRYRVWEANRKIFLWPENWLEPEFRDDRTHLFTELESTLLESDLDTDDVAAAFDGYLRGLDEIARLDIRSIYLEEKTDPAGNVLHVLARTYQNPHRYFYRRYHRRMWTPWQPVPVEIDGDHAAVVVWRDRVHICWVTFLEETEPDAGALSTQAVTGATFGALASLRPAYAVEAQLSWSEMFGDEWREPVATGFILRRQLAGPFAPQQVYIRAWVDNDRRLRVELAGGGVNREFTVTSGQGEPSIVVPPTTPTTPYPVLSIGPGRWRGNYGLRVSYDERTTYQGPFVESTSEVTAYILDPAESFEIVITPHQVGGLPAGVGELVRPFFYADRHGRHTFFVEPSVTQTTVEENDLYVLQHVPVDSRWELPQRWNELELVPAGPVPFPPPKIPATTDRATRSDAVVRFGGRFIGAHGMLTDAAAAADHIIPIDRFGGGPAGGLS